MKRLCSILLCVFALAACVRPLEEPDRRPAPYSTEGLPLTIEFTLPGVSVPGTKGLDEGGVLNTLHLAVFGGSGYLKEYVEAHPVQTADYTYITTDSENNPVQKTVPCYTFSATLTMSDSPRTIHLVGNGPSVIPFGYDTAVMPMQLSANGEMGYWQMISLPDGICAKRDNDGNYVDANNQIIPEGGTGYIPDEKTSKAFRGFDEEQQVEKGLALIRNWAKIVLSADAESNFTPYSMAVINVPSRGALAPYSGTTGFIEKYETRGFDYLDAIYPANLPAGTSFDDTIPSTDDFEYFRTNSTDTELHNGVANANGGAVYLYERPAPTDRIPPSFVIIYGYFTDPDKDAPGHPTDLSGYYYYKVDLMETMKIGTGPDADWTSRYYPIFRNFKYQILVKKILSPGQQTPAAAAAAAGSADVSADVTTSQLSDISDGIGRLHISPWMNQTFFQAHDENHPVTELSVFFSLSANGEPDMSWGTNGEDSHVKVELLPPADGRDPIIYNLEIGAPYDPDQDTGIPDYSRKGWRPVSFCTVAPGLTIRRQSIRITGTHEYGRLYRDVEITIQPVQPMLVTCDYPRVASTKGSDQVVTIHIPDGLGQSMFPLDFIIEAQDMTLSPDNDKPGNNLPVTSGTSISEDDGYAGKTAFQFTRTLTWDEYVGLDVYEDDEELMWRSIPAYFKTNRDFSATKIWVYNEFFQKASASFTNFNYKYFKNLHFTTPIPEEENRTITLQFQMIQDPDGHYPTDYPEVLISTRGLLCTSEGVEPGPSPGTYVIKPESLTVSLNFDTTTNDADIAVDLSAPDYEDGHVEAYRFPFFGLLDGHPLSNGQNWSGSSWSNIAYGYVNKDNNKTIVFGYKDHPDKLNTPVTLTINSGFTYASSFPVTPTGPRNTAGDNNYHEIELRTVGGYGDVVMTLSSPGYVSEEIRAGRFNGNIRTMRVTGNNVFKKNNTYNFTQSNPSFTFAEDNGNCTVQFSSISAETNANVTLAAGGTYTITISSNNANQSLFYVDMIFKTSGTTVYAPASFTANAGSISRYYGDNKQFVWSIPWGHITAQATLTAPPDRDIILTTMYIKAFNGSFYSNSQPIPSP